MENWLSDWQTDVALAGCEQCDWLYMLPPSRLPERCPHCGAAALAALDETTNKPVYTHPPELVLPFQVDPRQAQQKLLAFAKGTWFAPADLQGEKLNGRLQPLYLPLWLVDADVQAEWQAEMGFDYQVVSHQEEFQNNQWRTRQVKETRIRWEPRVGTLHRHYDNRVAPALEEQAAIEKKVGRFDRQEARPYQPDALTHAFARLPNRPPDDAWPDAQLALMQAAGEECQQAAAANHIRQYHWQPHFANTHWTQLLYPIYTTYYTDDDGKTHTLTIHGQTGRLAGRRLASMKKARRWSLLIGAVAAALFIVSFILLLAGLVYEVALAMAGLLFVVAVVTAVAAFIPILIAWYLNHHSQ
ncbi:MAG: hypothetical protein KJ069_18220 [Anaerolineae bacterium]|nr:hypothetical protein [Anaerolineae bacterium]